MASILALPDDIIFETFMNLRNIDDALHLGRACRRTHGLLERHRLAFMRSIILHSPIHANDIVLCHLLDAFQLFSSTHLRRPENVTVRHHIPPSARPTPTQFLTLLDATTLTDHQIWDIVARWHGLTPLLHMYIDPAISTKFRSAAPETFCSYYTGDPVALKDLLAYPPCHIYRYPADIRARFYKALTSIWLPIEAMRFAKAVQYPKESVMYATWDRIPRLALACAPDFRSSLDRLEVYEFVHCFLASQLPPCRRERLFEWFPFVAFGHGTWHRLVDADLLMIRCMLGPANIIELLIFSDRWSKRWSKPPSDSGWEDAAEWTLGKKLRYLGTNGVYQRLLEHDHHGARGAWPEGELVTIDDMEGSALRHLDAVISRKGGYLWDEYLGEGGWGLFYLRWRFGLRGRALLWEGREDDVEGWVGWAMDGGNLKGSGDGEFGPHRRDGGAVKPYELSVNPTDVSSSPCVKAL